MASVTTCSRCGGPQDAETTVVASSLSVRLSTGFLSPRGALDSAYLGSWHDITSRVDLLSQKHLGEPNGRPDPTFSVWVRRLWKTSPSLGLIKPLFRPLGWTTDGQLR
jgi:hypothetical protein